MFLYYHEDRKYIPLHISILFFNKDKKEVFYITTIPVTSFISYWLITFYNSLLFHIFKEPFSIFIVENGPATGLSFERLIPK